MKRHYPLKLLMLLLFMVPLALFGQTTVRGTVTDFGSGRALPGVSVVVPGTTVGTNTDANGNYTITLPTASGKLTFSFLGYMPQTFNITPAVTELEVQLKERVTNLNEVVVTGLATTVKRANAANAVSTINTREISGITTPQTMDAAISGKLVGASVVSNSGAPGGGISMKLRGITSIFGNSQPLYVVDGIIMDNSSISSGLNAVTSASGGGSTSTQDNASNRIADLNPDDIESIEILKGASAAAIYGSLASAGVVIITTKRGAAGKTLIDFSQDIGFAKAANLLGMRDLNEERVRASFGEQSVPLFIAARDAGRLIDYEEELYGNTGMLYSTRLNVSGGSEKTRFFVGGLIQDEEGIVKNTGYEKKSLRFNLDHTISERFDFSLSSNYINSTARRGLTNNDNAGVSFGVALSSTPSFVDLFPNESGLYPNNPYGASNFLQTRDLMTNEELTDRFLGGMTLNSYLQESATSNTKLVIRAGLDFYNLRTRALFPRLLQFQSNGNGTGGASIQGNNYNLNTNYAAFLVNNLNLADNTLFFTTTLGVTRENFNQDLTLNVATQLIGTQDNLDQAGAVEVEQTQLIVRNKGLFMQEEVNWRDRIIATAGLRLDKSSNNADVNEFNAFPKLSLALNLTNFNLWSDENFNMVKLRAAYGEAGGFPPFGAKFTSLIASNIGGDPGLLVTTQRGNQQIQQERQKEFEAGFDIGFMENRVLFEATYYIKTVSDLILIRNTPPASGFTTQVVNAGELQNRGVELSLSTVPVETPNFKWDSKLSYWTNESEITKLNVPAFPLGAFGNTLGTFFIEEGASATQIVGIKGEEGVVKLGDAAPDFQMNFHNFLTVRQNLTFSFLLHWKKGGQNINLTQLLTDLGGTSFDYDDDNDGDGISNAAERVSQLGVSAEPFVQDASYLRLREIGVYYTLPAPLLENAFGGFVRQVKIGASANNILTFTDYEGYDPEVSNFGGNGLSTGVDVTPFPSSKRYFFHFSIGF
ncbi:SusC/RagA family TonB-linked outer membrane protein [Pontibacter akesuensis]|uniref:TonB-linked outer membrane protein, SusC/RagA family n=1 Tax=Pontibacter akesuensis TaxID=388950 RepID=A0A1I7JYJ5_9BACT|nr:SusC/RagA family TonB-linked outer membrane protein [Pontibacter akesuensis]GHA76577.1 SusC/RagA family TonB-linked outer membrane protein [Pontibacter akesuensis]SFU90165.1 TonB-linked outer membrane protein, SusC/RagA family [Pontibacter akesuensis]